MGATNYTENDEERNQLETFYTSWIAISILTVTASTSVVSSGVIMFLILRRFASGLKTVYHRIIYWLSFSDIVNSFCMAVTTMPMPKDMMYHQYKGITIGNEITCNVQGMLYSVSTIGCALFTCMLCVYYLCSICYRMKDDTFRRRIEPLFYTAMVIIGALFTGSLTRSKIIHPSPMNLPICTIAYYPYWCDSQCNQDENLPLLLKGISSSPAYSMVSFAIIVLPLAITVRYVYIQERRLARFTISRNNRTSRSRNPSLPPEVHRRTLRYVASDIRYTKLILRQGLMYTAAYFTFIFYQLALLLQNRTYPVTTYDPGYVWVDIIRVVLRPLNGFFNMLIFVYHKIYNIQRRDRMLSFCQALRQLFGQDELEDPQYLFSNLTLVVRDGSMHLQAGREGDELDEINFSNSLDHNDAESSVTSCDTVSTNIHQT